jgi:hypothetical protein
MIDLTKSLKAFPVRKTDEATQAKDEAIRANAEKIAAVLQKSGVADRNSLYNARGNIHLPGGADVFAVVAYLDEKMQEAEQKAADKSQPAAKE